MRYVRLTYIGPSWRNPAVRVRHVEYRPAAWWERLIPGRTVRA